MSKQPHYEKNGAWVFLDVTTRPVIDRIAPRNQRTKYEGEGICLGAYVTGAGRPMRWHAYTQGITGQVWAQSSEGKGFWWVVDNDGRAWLMQEHQMTLQGQATDDPALFEVA